MNDDTKRAIEESVFWYKLRQAAISDKKLAKLIDKAKIYYIMKYDKRNNSNRN